MSPHSLGILKVPLPSTRPIQSVRISERSALQYLILNQLSWFGRRPQLRGTYSETNPFPFEKSFRYPQIPLWRWVAATFGSTRGEGWGGNSVLETALWNRLFRAAAQLALHRLGEVGRQPELESGQW